MKQLFIICLFLSAVVLSGCETINEAGRTTGRAVGEVANTVGTVTEGGAEAVQGGVSKEENPYNR